MNLPLLVETSSDRGQSSISATGSKLDEEEIWISRNLWRTAPGIIIHPVVANKSIEITDGAEVLYSHQFYLKRSAGSSSSLKSTSIYVGDSSSGIVVTDTGLRIYVDSVPPANNTSSRVVLFVRRGWACWCGRRRDWRGRRGKGDGRILLCSARAILYAK